MNRRVYLFDITAATYLLAKTEVIIFVLPVQKQETGAFWDFYLHMKQGAESLGRTPTWLPELHLYFCHCRALPSVSQRVSDNVQTQSRISAWCKLAVWKSKKMIIRHNYTNTDKQIIGCTYKVFNHNSPPAVLRINFFFEKQCLDILDVNPILQQTPSHLFCWLSL